MTKIILLSGLVLLPFYELIIYLLMPGGKIPAWTNFRVTKEYLALGLALALTVVIWNKIKRIECPNKWALFFLVFLWFNLSKSPIGAIDTVIDVSLLGNFTAEFKVFAFFLMFCSLASCRFSKEFIEKIFKFLFYGAVVMAGYMILQACNLDQILRPKVEYLAPGIEVKSVRVAGFLGQATISVPYIAMAIPLAVYFKKWWAIGVLSVALLLTGSDFAFLCLAFLGTAYLWGRKWPFIGVSAFLVTSFAILLKFSPGGFFSPSGRLNVWWMILKDVFSGEINGVPVRIGMFGAGLNNFGKIFTALHNTSFTRAHNEPLQVLWTCGVFGLGIFIMIHFDVFKTVWEVRGNKLAKPLFLSLMVMVLCSLGTFVYQLGLYEFLIILMMALIYQMREEHNDTYSINTAI